MAKPPFVFQKVSNHGVSHPVVARLVVQTDELLDFMDLEKAAKADVMEVFLDLHRRLLQCHDIAERIFVERDRTVSSHIEELRKGNSSLPYVINLDMEAENFLLVAKQYIRDLVKVLNMLLGAHLAVDSRVFWDRKGGGNSEVVKWAKKVYGDQHPTTKMFAEEDIWVSELVKKRNAVEHPGGYSGTLVIENYKFVAGGIATPSWRRDGTPTAVPTDIFSDIQVYLENMLTLAEDIVATAVHQNIRHKFIGIAEIPLEQRNKSIPKRLKMVMNEGLLNGKSNEAAG